MEVIRKNTIMLYIIYYIYEHLYMYNRSNMFKGNTIENCKSRTEFIYTKS